MSSPFMPGVGAIKGLGVPPAPATRGARRQMQSPEFGHAAKGVAGCRPAVSAPGALRASDFGYNARASAVQRQREEQAGERWRHFEDRYAGRWDSWGDYAQELGNEILGMDSWPEVAQRYFNWDSWVSDLKYNYSVAEFTGAASYVYIFRS